MASSVLSSSTTKHIAYKRGVSGVYSGHRARNMYYLTSKSGNKTIHLPNPEKPDGLKGTIATMVNSARNTKAEVTAQKIGEDQIKYELSWSFLSVDEWEEMLRFWDSNFIFRLHFYNSVKGRMDSKLCYISDRVFQYHDITDKGEPTAYIECSASMVDTGRS